MKTFLDRGNIVHKEGGTSLLKHVSLAVGNPRK